MPSSKQKITGSYTFRNQVRLIHGGRDYFVEMIRLIKDARESVHLQTYIFDDDETGNLVADELIAASRRGVKVYVLLDGYASRHLSEVFIRELLDAGINFRFFEPLLRSKNFYFGRRLHHKILVTDLRCSLVAGINVSNRYNDLPGQPAWLDWALLAEGEVSFELFKVCAEFWYKYARTARAVVSRSQPPEMPEDWDCAVRVRRNDWVRRKNQISRSYIEMFNRAEKEIIVMSSYFLPGRVIRRNMVRAVRRGVKVSLILAGTSDVPMAKYAERYIYRYLLRNGIHIHEYPKCVLHGKLSTYDSHWVTVGSYNVNDISAYASVELNLDVLDDGFATGVRKTLLDIIGKDCVAVTDDDLRKYNVIERFLQWWSYEVFRVVLFLFTFYFRQKDDH
jgi:cardiolipin synthase